MGEWVLSISALNQVVVSRLSKATYFRLDKIKTAVRLKRFISNLFILA